MMKVKWENANQLDMDTILSMALDGYEFCVNDGRIISVVLNLEEAA